MTADKTRMTVSSDDTTVYVKPSEETEQVVIDTGEYDLERSKFSGLKDGKVDFSDFYKDARTFLQKTNSTKFIIICYNLIVIPSLLVLGYIPPSVYQNMVIMLTMAYLGVDVYEKQAMVKKHY